MQEMGLEPTRGRPRQILSLMRLPFRHSCKSLFSFTDRDLCYHIPVRFASLLFQDTFWTLQNNFYTQQPLFSYLSIIKSLFWALHQILLIECPFSLNHISLKLVAWLLIIPFSAHQPIQPIFALSSYSFWAPSLQVSLSLSKNICFSKSTGQ